MKTTLPLITTLTALVLSLFWTADTEAQLNWEKYENNPVLYGNSGDWDTQCWFPVVIHDEGIFKMWYNGSEWGGDRQIGYATSEDGIEWTKDENNPVIPGGEDYSWDHHRYPGTVLRVDDTLRMWWDGTLDSGPVLAVGYAWFDEEEGEWILLEDPVLEHGESGTWDDVGVFMASVYYDTIYHMYYSGIGSWVNTGYATSYNGIDWTKYEDNPVIHHGEVGTFYSEWAASNGLVVYNDTLHMFFNGFDGSAWSPNFSYFRVGYAWSIDYVTWTIETPWWPVVDVGLQGAWDDRAVRAPCVIVHEGRLKMWYAGYPLSSTIKIGYALGDTVINYTGVGLPDNTALSATLHVSPSPFTREANFSYRLAESSAVRIAVYNGSGQVVTILVDDTREPGEHRVVLDGRNLPAGVYFCVLTTPQKTETKKIIKLQ